MAKDESDDEIEIVGIKRRASVDLSGEVKKPSKSIDIESESDSVPGIEVHIEAEAGFGSNKEPHENNKKCQQIAKTHIGLHLTGIKNLSESFNRDTVRLADYIGGSTLTAMWQFNYSISIPYVMSQLHPETRYKAKCTFVHGYYHSKEDPSREVLSNDARMFPNVVVDGVYVPRGRGTHHSKVMVLFHENQSKSTCQIVIHTANLIPFDWENTTQGLWASPPLRLIQGSEKHDASRGSRFKRDFLEYIGSYRHHQSKTAKSLVDKLQKYDFSPINVVLIASVPGNYLPGSKDIKSFGISKLQRVLVYHGDEFDNQHDDYLVAQVSSIATLGNTDTYLRDVLENAFLGRDFYDPTDTTQQGNRLKIIFPTVNNVRNSLNGYESGGSLFLRRQSPKDLLQYGYLKSKLCQWYGDKAGRTMAAPHIKTYCRVSKDSKHVRWLLLTSANLSKPAWGTINKAKKNMYISSFECGVLFLPENATSPGFVPEYRTTEVPGQKSEGQCDKTLTLTLRMPYDLPPKPYSHTDQAWSPNEARYPEPDCLGRIWDLS